MLDILSEEYRTNIKVGECFFAFYSESFMFPHSVEKCKDFRIKNNFWSTRFVKVRHVIADSEGRKIV
jgi:hypothetical protein